MSSTENDSLKNGRLKQLIPYIKPYRGRLVVGIIMDKGKIIEQGTHTELLEKGGKYKYFHDMQFSEKENGETNVDN